MHKVFVEVLMQYSRGSTGSDQLNFSEFIIDYGNDWPPPEDVSPPTA